MRVGAVRKLILVRHSLPEVVPGMPAAQWGLGTEGRSRCVPLSEKLRVHEPRVIVSSLERKAVETAEIVAERLGKTFETVVGLHEQDRSNLNETLDEAEFEGTISALFDRPDQLVMGRETGAQARDRFVGSVENVFEKWPGGNVVIIAHGTVMTLFVANCVEIRPFEFWKRLGLPSFVVLSLPELGTAVHGREPRNTADRARPDERGRNA